jgi:hypothetical protein
MFSHVMFQNSSCHLCAPLNLSNIFHFLLCYLGGILFFLHFSLYTLMSKLLIKTTLTQFSCLYCNGLDTVLPHSCFIFRYETRYLFPVIFLYVIVFEYCYTWFLLFNLLSLFFLLCLTTCIPSQLCIFHFLGLLPNRPISDFLSTNHSNIVTIHLIQSKNSCTRISL